MADYNTGIAMGNIQGEKDSRLLLPPSLLVKDNDDAYQAGYRNGYYIGYTKGLSVILRSNINDKLTKLIGIRLSELSDIMFQENTKAKQKRY